MIVTSAHRAAVEIVGRIEENIGDFPGMNVGNVEASEHAVRVVGGAQFVVNHREGRFRVTVEEIDEDGRVMP